MLETNYSETAHLGTEYVSYILLDNNVTRISYHHYQVPACVCMCKPPSRSIVLQVNVWSDEKICAADDLLKEVTVIETGNLAPIVGRLFIAYPTTFDMF